MPVLPFCLYLTANNPSEYLVAIPKSPVIHIQNIAPGPPNAIAVATPTIFPVPTVEANAVINAENCEISPSCSDLLNIILKARGSDLN